MLTTALLATACSSGNGGDNATIIDKPDFKPTDRQYTICLLYTSDAADE